MLGSARVLAGPLGDLRKRLAGSICPVHYALVGTNLPNSQAIAVKPGGQYRACFWYKVLSGKPKFYLDLFAGLGSGDGHNGYPSLTAHAEWHRCSITLPASEFSPEQVIALRFVAHGDPQRILTDDVEVLEEPIHPETPCLGADCERERQEVEPGVRYPRSPTRSDQSPRPPARRWID